MKPVDDALRVLDANKNTSSLRCLKDQKTKTSWSVDRTEAMADNDLEVKNSANVNRRAENNGMLFHLT